MTQLESSIQSRVTDYAKSIGLVPLRLHVVGRKGWPDYGYGYKSRMCFVEFKRPGESPEPLQDYVHEMLRDAGFKVYVVDNYEYGIALLSSWRSYVEQGVY